jgi:hypothetical protein
MLQQARGWIDCQYRRHLHRLRHLSQFVNCHRHPLHELLHYL